MASIPSMQTAVEQNVSPLTNALATRFGGGVVARLAASKALQTRQASAESSGASREASALVQDAPSRPEPEPEPGATQAEGPSDDALLLSGLLNSADAAARAGQGLLGRLQQRAALDGVAAAGEASHGSSPGRGALGCSADSDELSPEASGSAASFANAVSRQCHGGGSTLNVQGHVATQLVPLPGEEEPCMCAHMAAECSQQRDSLQDAEDDAVLTGSPQASTGGSSRAGSPSASTPAAEPAGPAAGPQPAPAGSGLDPASVSAHAPLPGAVRPQLTPLPPKAAVVQQVWDFAAIPQGTASIPSKVAAQERRPAKAAGSGGRTAFYTRAASPQPHPLVAVPAPAAATAAGWRQPHGHAGAGPLESRRERLERLARPKQPAQPARWQPPAVPAAANLAGRLGSKASTARAGSKRASAVAERGTIAAWRPAHADEPTAGPAELAGEGPHALARAPEAAGGHSLQWQAASGSSASQRSRSTDRSWPVALGRPLEGAELERATGAYSEERFQAHMAALQQALAPHQLRRQQEAEAAAAGVDELVARMHGLGTGTPANAIAMSREYKPWDASVQAEVEATQLQLPGSIAVLPAWKAQTAHLPPAKQPCAGGILSSLAQEALPASPTERLLVCRQLLQLHPFPSPRMGSDSPVPQAAPQRMSSGSPGKVKSLMQVKGDQDAELTRLQQQPRPFRASPLPLSTMEPRYQRQGEQQGARRQAAHAQRRQQLLEQQQPFGFEERAVERAQRRQLLHGGGPGSPLAAAGISRPDTPAFHAQPVPVATTEARYALLAAELQLRRRPATTAVAAPARPASPNCRPATAAACWRPPSRASRGHRAHLVAALDAGAVAASTPKASCAAWPAGQAAPTKQEEAARGAAPVDPAEMALAGSLPTAAGGEQDARCSAAGVQPAAEAAEAECSPRWEAGSGGAEREPGTTARPGPLPQQALAGDKDFEQAGQAPAAEAAPAATIADSRAAEQHDGEAALTSSVGSPQLQPGTACIEAAVSRPDQGWEAGGPAVGSCPVVQRLGSRGSSFTGESALLEAGIAVPVAISSLEAAVRAELLADSLQASLTTDTWQRSTGPAAAAAVAGEQRQDTPPQHIAARHQQVAAAARREVEATLARRGLRLGGL